MNENGFKVGDLLSYSWGYEQTNVDFFEVVGLTAKTVTLREVERRVTENGFMCGTSVPVPGAYRGEPMRKKVGGTPDAPRVSMDYGSARKWDGKPERCSWYA
jgi:hypothetical protein